MHRGARDAYLLFMNNKPMAVLPGLEASKRLAERVATAEPTMELVLRVANPRRCELGHSLVKDATPAWLYDTRTRTWQELLLHGPTDAINDGVAL